MSMFEKYPDYHYGFNVDGRPHGWFSEIDGVTYLEVVKRHPGEIVVEVGVWQGRSLSWILEYCKSVNSQIYAVDNWWGENDDHHMLCSMAYKYFISNLKIMGGNGFVKIIKKTSVEAAKDFEEKTVGVVLIDASHNYEDVINDIDAWWPKLKDGGEMVGHDYIQAWPGVVKAVEEKFGKPDYNATSTWAVKKIEGRKKT